MSKMSSYKKLYLTGFIFVGFIIVCLVFSIYHVSKLYENKVKPKKIDSSNLTYMIDTVYREKLIEKVKIDTFKIYVYPKPKIKTDSIINPPSTSSTQSQD